MCGSRGKGKTIWHGRRWPSAGSGNQTPVVITGRNTAACFSAETRGVRERKKAMGGVCALADYARGAELCNEGRDRSPHIFGYKRIS